MPDPTLAQQLLLRQPPKRIGEPIPLPTEDKNPTVAKTAFEGGIDTLLGFLGVGPETKANLTGQLGMAGVPLAGAIKGIPGMYSRLARAAEEMPDKMTAAAAKNWLMQRASKEEMAYTSTLGTLENKNPMEKVSKGEILDHVKKNPLDVEVKEYGNLVGRGTPRNPEFTQPDQATQYSQYTLPGGQNYRETLIKLADKPDPKIDPEDFLNWYKKTYPNEFLRPEAVQAYLDQGYKNLPEEFGRYAKEKGLPPVKPKPADSFRGAHFQSDPNTLVWTRHDERPLAGAGETLDEFTQLLKKHGIDNPESVAASEFQDPKSDIWKSYLENSRPKGRMLQEVQSDWEKASRDRGFKLPPAEAQKLEQEYKQGVTGLAQLREELEANPHAAAFDQPFNERYKAQIARNRELEAALAKNDTAVPDNPFKEKVYELALKQQLIDAAKNPNIEWLGITPPEVQIDRYGTERFRWAKEPGSQRPMTIGDLDKLPEAEQQRIVAAHQAGQPLPMIDLPPRWKVSFEPQVGGQAVGVADVGEEAIRRGLIKNQSTTITSPGELNALLGDSEVKAEKAWKRLQASPEFGEYLPRAEGFKQFYGEYTPNTIGKLVKPLGGKIEQADVVAGPADRVSYAPSGRDQMIHRYTNGGVPNGGRNEEVASLYPTQPHWDSLSKDERDSLINRLVELTQTVEASAPAQREKTIRAAIMRFSPELRDKINDGGFSLLAFFLLVKLPNRTPMLFLTTILTKTPAWIKTGLVMGLLLVVFEVKHRWETKKLNDQVVALSESLKTEQLNNARLQIGVEQQNAAIGQLSAQSKRIAADAATRALRVLKAEQASSAQLISPQTTVKPGAAAMNEWLHSKFPEAK